MVGQSGWGPTLARRLVVSALCAASLLVGVGGAAAATPRCVGDGTPAQWRCAFRDTGAGTTRTVPAGITSATSDRVRAALEDGGAGGGTRADLAATPGDTFATDIDLSSAHLTVAPTSVTAAQGSSQSIAVTLTDADGTPVPYADVGVTAAGANDVSTANVTDSSGETTISYTGQNAGIDHLTFYVLTETNGVYSRDPNGPTAMATVDWIGPPASISIAPSSDRGEVGAPSPAFTATVRDALGQPVPGPVTFRAAGVNAASETASADAAGEATFSYVGQSPGTDTITATAGGVSGTATMTWTGPPAAIFYGGDFGDVGVGDRSASIPVLVENQFSRPLHIATALIRPKSDFTITADECTNMTLAQYATCSVYVRVRPSKIGARYGNLEIIDDGDHSPQWLLLTATGIVSGARGPQGPVGPRGAVGPRGPVGSRGPQGPTGKLTCTDAADAVALCSILLPRAAWTTEGTPTAIATISRQGHVIVRSRVKVHAGRASLPWPGRLKSGRYVIVLQQVIRGRPHTLKRLTVRVR